MRNLLVSMLIIAAVLGASLPAFAKPGEETSAPESTPFTLLIVGTRHFSDVDVVKTNIQKMPAVRGFAQKVSSQNHIEFSGTYSGNVDSLVEDIEGLAMDRYTVQSKSYKDRGLVVTMRKIPAGAQ